MLSFLIPIKIKTVSTGFKMIRANTIILFVFASVWKKYTSCSSYCKDMNFLVNNNTYNNNNNTITISKFSNILTAAVLRGKLQT